MGHNDKSTEHVIDWQIGIPIALWIVCITLGILKVVLPSDFVEKDTVSKVIDILNAFNSNTFSTFISITVCMLYQYFSIEQKGYKQISGLSMKNIPATIIISLAYGIIAVIDATISHIAMTIIFCIVGISYILCFFKIFLAKTK